MPRGPRGAVLGSPFLLGASRLGPPGVGVWQRGGVPREVVVGAPRKSGPSSLGSSPSVSQAWWPTCSGIRWEMSRYVKCLISPHVGISALRVSLHDPCHASALLEVLSSFLAVGEEQRRSTSAVSRVGRTGPDGRTAAGFSEVAGGAWSPARSVLSGPVRSVLVHAERKGGGASPPSRSMSGWVCLPGSFPFPGRAGTEHGAGGADGEATQLGCREWGCRGASWGTPQAEPAAWRSAWQHTVFSLAETLTLVTADHPARLRAHPVLSPYARAMRKAMS